MPLQIVPADQANPIAVKEFTDGTIGKNYYSVDELKEKIKKSYLGDQICSFVLMDNKAVVGLRLTFPPQNWSLGKGEGLSSHLWPYSLEETAYFQSLFIHPDYRHQGWGTQLSQKSIEVLKKKGVAGIVCHSWVESPQNSSVQYLKSLGFKSICQYPLYWNAIDYYCSRCGKPCVCTAEEMYLNLKELK